MILNQIKILNYKGIKDMQIRFAPGINLLIGDNGVGKTSVLDALSVALGGFFTGIKGVHAPGIWQTDIRFETHRLAGASTTIEYMNPTAVDCEANVDGEIMKWVRARDEGPLNPRTKISNREIAKYAAQISNDANHLLPLIRYVGTSRVINIKRNRASTGQKQLKDRRCGYIGCLDSGFDTEGIKDWCLKMEMAAFHQKNTIPEYEAFKATVSSIMKKMSDLEIAPKISYSRIFEDIVYSERDKEEIPIQYLSAGYQSLLWMSVDLAYRLALLNPGQLDFSLATGVVLIDELDMHLHPKWQWNVLGALEETFPNIQFIIATHSPIIISSCKNGQLIMLDSEQTISYVGNAYAYSIMDVLELKQGALGVPKELRDLSQKFDKALNSEDYEEAKGLLEKMKARYGTGNSEVRSAMLELELGDSD